MRSALIALMAVSCVKVGPLREYHEELTGLLEQTQVDDWAEKCAPRELALAESNREFGELELQQGDPRRAETHLLYARDNAIIAIEKAEACRPKDRDGDQIFDHRDACPDEPENYDGFEDEDGCPEFDRDRDGIVDTEDACPDDPEDMDGFKDTDGCPEIDNDEDGLVDSIDKCPNDPEDFNGYQDEDGCPEGVIDRDGDSILDHEDACPDEPENVNEYLDEDGCPDVKPQNVRITQERIEIDEKIMFQTGKSKILPQSYGILDSVSQVLRDYPLLKVRVEGHTDSQGSETYNQRLSESRAGAVREYMLGKGVESSRIESVGVGETTPVDTNRTAAGRTNNRRVEFHIVESN